jgi:2-polyprenyl-3-methyl-5-hydroxy-6-metoxy-1,4-benzoquinol methylase
MGLFREKYDRRYFDINIPFLMRTKEKASLVRSFKKSGDLLEIGYADGLLLNELKGDFNISGIDISRSAFEIAVKSIDRARLKIADIETHEFTAKYDVILAFDVLEHLKNPESVMLKLKKALKKNGLLIFSAPNNHGIFGTLVTSAMNFFDRTHVSAFKRRNWIQILSSLGFRSIAEINVTIFGYMRHGFSKYFASTFVLAAEANSD